MPTRVLCLIVAVCACFGSAVAGEFDLKPTLWSGFYFTALGGSMSRDIHNTFRGDHTDVTSKEAGYGGALGYNGQWLNIVWGGEGDMFRSTDGRYLETLRGRLGWSVGPVLFFGTAGVGWSKFNSGFANFQTDSGSAKTLHSGFAYGGGMEWQVNTWLSVRGDVVAVDFDHKSITSAWGYTLNQSAESVVYRLGVSYYIN